jgi:4-alpha-glucanotransferase
MFNLTNKAMNHFLNFFKSDEKEESIKEFCQSEYKKDWYAAYMTFKQEGRFPNFIRRTL